MYIINKNIIYILYINVGESFVNGIQCVYAIHNENASEIKEIDEILIATPLFTSYNDTPTPYVLDLRLSTTTTSLLSSNISTITNTCSTMYYDMIENITIKHGALIDSISIETRAGQKLHVGGNGGGNSTKVNI